MICGTTYQLENFSAVWPKVRARAERIIPELDIARARRRHNEGDAVCLMNEDGIVVLTLTPTGATMTAFVLLAASTGVPGAFKRQESAIVKIAEDMGAQHLAFRTDRPGWARIVGPRWTHVGDHYARAVP